MKKFFFCVSLVLTGLMTSCVDKYEEVDAESKPTWLGSSIYAELKNPNQERLTGTFDTYLRLVDDLGYAETLNRTGSKTVFPANDEAFERFFSSNEWGVSSYEQLSEAQKKLLLYSSMLDNALLLGMLPTASNNSAEPMKGYALKHPTNVSIIDTVQFVPSAADMPANNGYWTKYYDKGINLVSDATRPMMVHLTREFMLTNDLTTTSDQNGLSDFEVLTGTPYEAGMAFVFNNRIINSDVTCQNGYVHQMENVIVPPGNMAQVLRRHQKTHYFSRMLDYFAVPYYDASTTRNYNDWAKTNGLPEKDSIFQLRYLSARSQGGASNNQDPNRVTLSTDDILSFDPGWNQYYPKPAREQDNIDYPVMDMGAFFVPSDEAVKKYFLPGGNGAYLIDIYGDLPNTDENLPVNIDSLYAKNKHVVAAFVKNLMKASFVGSVPSKFSTVPNDAGENMGLTINHLERSAEDNTRYDITMANNGAVYVINELIAPDEYQAVMAPSSVFPDLRVMNWAIKDGHDNGDYLGVDFKYYLLAMSANYAFFVPEDAAFDLYYLDPTSLGHEANGAPNPEVLHFYYDDNAKAQPYVKCDRYYYNIETGEISGNPRPAAIATVKTQLVDILNYHTVVLNSGEVIGQNHFYKTKHGGEIYVDGNITGGRVMGGAQLEDPEHFPAPEIKQIYNEKNGNTYRLSRVIQPPHKSVYAVLNENPQFSLFLEACTGFGATELLTWAGISDEKNEATGSTPQDSYTIFTRNYKLGSTSTEEACLDYNVKMFNTYNYTLFAPDNTAMNTAYANYLPRWSDIYALYQKYAQLYAEDPDHTPDTAEQADIDKAFKMITSIRNFVRYHFVTNSVYADNIVESAPYTSLCSDELGVAKEVRVSGGEGLLTISDLKSGHTVTVNAGDTQRLVNKMTRDYWFNAKKTTATAIETSSFCAVHQISEPLYNSETGRFDQ